VSGRVQELLTLSPLVESFLDTCRVLAVDDDERARRLALLREVERLFLDVADLSKART